MPEQRFETKVRGEVTKNNWSDMNTEQKVPRMPFSGIQSLLLWCRQQTERYSEVNVINMTTSWRDGLAFCAIIHRFRPDLIEFDRLSKQNILENNELAFSLAEKHFGIPMVLDASDLLENEIPDKLSVITYVSQLYEYFKNRTPANQGYATKMNIKPKVRAEAKGHKGSKRTSPSNQMVILSGHAKRMATALRNVFKSDPKDESSKGKETDHTSKYLGAGPIRPNLEATRHLEEPSPNTARKSPFLGNDCWICHSRVYLMERLIAERKLFHRACFRCHKCSACLRPGTYHYFPETDKFCCLFDCTGGQKETPIKIMLEPIIDAAQNTPSQEKAFSKTSTGSNNSDSTELPEQAKSSLQRQFSIVKRNPIQLNALPQPLSQGKANITRSPGQSLLSKSPTKTQRKVEGEKRRRLSGRGKAKNKQETKQKHSRTGKQFDHTRASWSPVHKRWAPETMLDDRIEDNTVRNVNADHPSNAFKLTVPNEAVLSKEGNKLEKEDENPIPLIIKEKKILREDSFYEAPTENLFFSFKEELLKRATESQGKDIKEGDQVIKGNELLVKGCASKTSKEKKKTSEVDNDIKEIDSLGNGAEIGDGDVGIKTGRKCSGKDRKHSEDDTCSVRSDSIRGSGSHKNSDVDAPVVSKSVQKLREKFLNINDIIEEKHKTNIAKKSQEIQRELRCVSAWKQQTETHVAASRKLSASVAGKSAELKNPSIGTNRRSVKELRKMYMGDEHSETKGSKAKFMMRSKSMKASVNTERTSSASEAKEDHTQAPQEEIETNTDSTEFNTTCKEDSAVISELVGDETEREPQGRAKSCADSKSVVVIQVEDSPRKREENIVDGNEVNASCLSSNQIGNLSHETRTFTVIKSEDDRNCVPSLQIELASPELPYGEQCSPELQRHNASHDSGIDEPPYGQHNLLISIPGEKVSAESVKVAAEFSFPESGSSVLSPNAQALDEEPNKEPQSPDVPLSPGSDVSPIEVFWSLPLSTGNRASLTDTSSSCSSPRMSVVIAQEASMTKINSRYFTVESTEPWDFEDYRIAEERQCVMEVEGEFSFGREKSKTSRAEREAIFSLHREAKNHGLNSTGAIKEEEIMLSPSEIDSELQALAVKHGVLERRGVEIEQDLRESMDSEGPYDDYDDELLLEWLNVVHERNKIMRRESELIYLLQSHSYEEKYRTVEGELRKLVAMRDEVKSSDDLKRERELLSELLELVQKRSFIVDSLEEERVREIQEDEKVEQALTEGIAALPGNCWDQKQDVTKVAFSRFYC